MTKPKSKKQTIELPDVMAQELVNIINKTHEAGKLVTGFVILMEVFDNKKKTIRIVSNEGMPQYQQFGMISYAHNKFEYSMSPDEDDDDDFYDPEWYRFD